MGCPPVRKIIHSLKLVDYLHVQADNPWYNYNIFVYESTDGSDESVHPKTSLLDNINSSVHNHSNTGM